MFVKDENITYQIKDKKNDSNIIIDEQLNRVMFDGIPVINAFAGTGRMLTTHRYGDAFSFFSQSNILYETVKEHAQILTEFFKICAKERGIRYKDIAKLLKEENGFGKTISLLRLPVLENAMELNIHILSEKIAERIDEVKTNKDIYMTLFVHSF